MSDILSVILCPGEHASYSHLGGKSIPEYSAKILNEAQSSLTENFLEEVKLTLLGSSHEFIDGHRYFPRPGVPGRPTGSNGFDKKDVKIFVAFTREEVDGIIRHTWGYCSGSASQSTGSGYAQVARDEDPVEDGTGSWGYGGGEQY